MIVCYFGTYDADYVRNRVLIEGLRAQGVRVIECHRAVWANTEQKVRAARRGILNPRLWLAYARAYAGLLGRYLRVGHYDIMVVGYAGHFDVLLARALTWLARKPLVFDAFLSLHETVVVDRGLTSDRSLLARFLYGIESVGCALADRVLLDTAAHARYFAAKYALPIGKFRRLWVGAEDVIYHPGESDRVEGTLVVIYFGKFIPLHGVEHILEAARELREHTDIRFEFVGGGQTYAEMRHRAEEWQLANVDWGPEWLAPHLLAERVRHADVCLGIFGTSEKATRVIPTKAYVALAMRKALITEDSPAAREVLIHGQHALLCPAGDAQALARCILALKENARLRAEIAQNGYTLFRERFTPQAIGAELKTILEETIAHR